MLKRLSAPLILLATLAAALLAAPPASAPARPERTISGRLYARDPLTGEWSTVLPTVMHAAGEVRGHKYSISVYYDSMGRPTRVVAHSPTRKADVVGYSPAIVEED